MDDLFWYDTMMATDYKKMSDHVLPILSWEFYGEQHVVLEGFREDLVTLKKITENWEFTRDYYNEFLEKQSVIIITNPTLKIVYASQNIQQLNGYMPDEVLGKSPKMFQGEETCSRTSKIVRAAVDNKIPFEVSLLNYRKDRTTYMCKIKGFPVCNKRGKLINYIAFEKVA
ncbi:PAS domain-containing protein [Aquimarina sp. I32.4]|uniref:PAS domain-containing protein n=1 Tax=Aquimarina sp. I32.4 TaxID=2053903 RepID=UPI000CDEC7BD|nr:PAS domain-containing protein [Aquimarina sp. I32.4]